MTIDACVGTDCVSPQLDVSIDSASCREASPTGQMLCTARPIDSTHIELQLRWIDRSPTIGDEVTVVVSDATTSTVFLDAAGTVTTVASDQICGTHCAEAEVVLVSLP